MSDIKGPDAVGNNLADAKSAGEALHGIGDKAAKAGVDAVGQAKELAGEVQDTASSLLSALEIKASTVAEEQKKNVVGYLEDVADAVHRSGEQLEGHQDWVAQLVERGADELGALATTLRTNDLQSLLGSLGSLARREPALFVGASMAAGFAMARVGRVAASASPTSPEASARNQTPSAPFKGRIQSSTPAAPPPEKLASLPMQQVIQEAHGERQ